MMEAVPLELFGVEPNEFDAEFIPKEKKDVVTQVRIHSFDLFRSLLTNLSIILFHGIYREEGG
jgi:hypothetical protein